MNMFFVSVGWISPLSFENPLQEISDKISSIRYRGDLILICNHLEELHQLLKLKLYKKVRQLYGKASLQTATTSFYRRPTLLQQVPKIQNLLSWGIRRLNSLKMKAVRLSSRKRLSTPLQTMLNGFISNHNEQSYHFHWDMKLQAIETIFLMGPLKGMAKTFNYMA
ncbi:uncharacterized protein PGTG_12751 [Puccinia graminis f. sp. tritici CRL 75-36-700-3]|uniref:Uncharacterized protein n=1 Tax=Puccinia graminis f. sp. tritici (strain CRL 75-36-700-3 / race SCCL) TaxID=418459 RepID=E3KRT5_PUCGT|nr:uncharacterized protein PGTG_12751 [Puccinia graminis f. sp. tritici CRL 75-36-700-3]EFP87010.1 hypothetical protein PGTG_12751 [Puccinia graminis f. sp. tritici CRL 75-36-700-3]